MGHLHREPAELAFEHEVDEEDYDACGEAEVNPGEEFPGGG